MAFCELVHVCGCDHGTLAAVQGEDRRLNEIVICGVCGINPERARIDNVLAVVQNDELRAILSAEHLREHLIEHLALRGRCRQTIDDNAHTIGMFCLQFLGDAHRPRIIGIDAQAERDLGDLNAGKVPFHHFSKHILLMPVGHEDGGRWDAGFSVTQPRSAMADDPHREKIDEGVIERRHADQQAD